MTMRLCPLPLLVGLALALVLPGTAAHARDYGYSYGSMHVTVEPVVGFEWAPKLAPTQHLHGRLMYGARIIGGMPYLSLEGEYTHATDQEEFPGGFSTQDNDDRIRLGLRSGYNLNQFFEVHARAGGQAEKNQHQETSGGVTTSTSNPIEYHPYVGLGCRAAISSRVSATADVVVTIHDIHDMQQNEYQMTAGFAIQFP